MFDIRIGWSNHVFLNLQLGEPYVQPLQHSQQPNQGHPNNQLKIPICTMGTQPYRSLPSSWYHKIMNCMQISQKKFVIHTIPVLQSEGLAVGASRALIHPLPQWIWLSLRLSLISRSPPHAPQTHVSQRPLRLTPFPTMPMQQRPR